VHCFTLSSMLSMYSFFRRRESCAETCDVTKREILTYA
jgi:hypothetical protein